MGKVKYKLTSDSYKCYEKKINPLTSHSSDKMNRPTEEMPCNLTGVMKKGQLLGYPVTVKEEKQVNKI